MTTIDEIGTEELPNASPDRVLPPEAQRALAEAEARRAAQASVVTARVEETGGRKGPDPVRFGDWETGGIASDF